jgi:ribosomal protein S21
MVLVVEIDILVIKFFMHSVEYRKGEDIDRALKRLKNKMDVDYVLETVRAKRYFETAADKKKRKARALDKKRKLNR